MGRLAVLSGTALCLVLSILLPACRSSESDAPQGAADASVGTETGHDGQTNMKEAEPEAPLQDVLDVNVEVGATCADGLTLKEYCDVCATDWADLWMSDFECDEHVCGGTVEPDTELPGATCTLSAGCGYVVRNCQWNGAGNGESKTYVFDASSLTLVGFLADSDENWGHLCGAHTTLAGVPAPEGCLCECSGVAACKTIAANIGCDAGLDAPPDVPSDVAYDVDLAAMCSSDGGFTIDEYCGACTDPGLLGFYKKHCHAPSAYCFKSVTDPVYAPCDVPLQLRAGCGFIERVCPGSPGWKAAFDSTTGKLVGVSGGDDSSVGSLCEANGDSAGTMPPAGCTCLCSTVEDCMAFAHIPDCDAGSL